ncbi:MAG: hypothetical protein DRH26_05390 [Deltaproteobacteria bacterium]|nr:MAG: hypothetical protein DRH26_05390 [Deltaproteobacteria bacterium]
MSHKNILVPLGQDSKDLKALYHALSLAARIQSKLFVFSFEAISEKPGKKSPVIEACLDVIHSACEEGLQISFHIAADNSQKEFLELLEREHIDLIIISDTEIRIEKMIKQIMPQISCQVVQVETKNNVNFLS